MEAGKAYTLTAHVQPAGALRSVVWGVEGEESGASFVQNVLTATKAGRIVVRATSAAKSSLSDSVSIEVMAAPQPSIALSAEVSPTVATLDVGGTLKLGVTVEPTNAIDRSVVWSSSAEGIVSVDETGRVRGLNAGEAVITARSVSGGHEATGEITVLDTCVTSVESSVLAGVWASPNPFDGECWVHHADSLLHYEVVNVWGSVVMRGGDDGSSVLQLSAWHLPAGCICCGWLQRVLKR